MLAAFATSDIHGLWAIDCLKESTAVLPPYAGYGSLK